MLSISIPKLVKTIFFTTTSCAFSRMQPCLEKIYFRFCIISFHFGKIVLKYLKGKNNLHTGKEYSMAKKIGKFLLFVAAVAAIAAGIYYYLQRKKDADFDFDDEDLSDTEDADFDDFDEKDTRKRSYVDLNLDASATDTNASKAETDTSHAQRNTAVVEEFFNDETTE